MKQILGLAFAFALSISVAQAGDADAYLCFKNFSAKRKTAPNIYYFIGEGFIKDKAQMNRPADGVYLLKEGEEEPEFYHYGLDALTKLPFPAKIKLKLPDGHNKVVIQVLKHATKGIIVRDPSFAPSIQPLDPKADQNLKAVVPGNAGITDGYKEAVCDRLSQDLKLPKDVYEGIDGGFYPPGTQLRICGRAKDAADCQARWNSVYKREKELFASCQKAVKSFCSNRIEATARVSDAEILMKYMLDRKITESGGAFVGNPKPENKPSKAKSPGSANPKDLAPKSFSDEPPVPVAE